MIEPGRGVKIRMSLCPWAGLRFRIVKRPHPLRVPPIRRPEKQHPASSDAARLVQGLLAGPSASSQCEPLLSRYWSWTKARMLARGVLICETSEDCKQHNTRAEQHSHGAFSERTWPAMVHSRSGNESRSNTLAGGVVARESAYSDTGGSTKLEIPPTCGHRSGIIQHLTKFDGLTQQRTRRARIAET